MASDEAEVEGSSFDFVRLFEPHSAQDAVEGWCPLHHPSTEFIPSEAEGLGPSGLVLAQDAVEGWSLIEAFFGRVHPEPFDYAQDKLCRGAQDGSFGSARPNTSKHPEREADEARGVWSALAINRGQAGPAG